MSAAVPRTLTFSGAKLAEMKASHAAPREVLESLRAQAEAYLDAPTFSVICRKQRGTSGDPHDYASYGPYWWPDPEKPDGLPYIRRDGEVNPTSVEPISYGGMAERAWILALAAYWFDDVRFAAKSRDYLYDWHLNPETCMNPHARYGQAIPGVCDGRGIGIIDFSNSYDVFNAAALLEVIGGICDDELAALKDWYSRFIDWMITSEIGLSEDVHPNNHGTYYDLQVLGAAVFTGREWLAKKICQTAYQRRIAAHVEPSGAQPLELARTRAMSYSQYNLIAMIHIANIADHLGFGAYWQKDPVQGVCFIRAAADYLYPYIVNPETFPYQQIVANTGEQTGAQIYALLDAHFPGEGYAEKSARWQTADMLWRAVPAR